MKMFLVSTSQIVKNLMIKNRNHFKIDKAFKNVLIKLKNIDNQLIFNQEINDYKNQR